MWYGVCSGRTPVVLSSRVCSRHYRTLPVARPARRQDSTTDNACQCRLDGISMRIHRISSTVALGWWEIVLAGPRVTPTELLWKAPHQ